eukprot:5204315-Lingulodinium_polyedra.AAC.1
MEAARAYAERVEKMREEAKADESINLADAGAPFLTVWVAVAKYMAAKSEGESKECFTRYWKERVMKVEKEELQNDVWHFRFKKNRGKETKKKAEGRFFFKFNHNAENQVVPVAKLEQFFKVQLAKEGAQRKCGAAPRGPLGR